MEISNNLDGIYNSRASRGYANGYSGYVDAGESRRRRTAILSGAIAMLIYLAMLCGAMFLFSFDRPTPNEDSIYGGAILVSFGNDSSGSGEAARGGSSNSLLTQRESEVKMQSNDGEQPMERVVNSRALFPGADSSSHELNQGAESGAGASKSNQNGSDDSETGNAESLSGNYSLEGRKLLGDLPLPDYEADAHGRVIMNITVDETGRVTMARLESVGSTTNNTILIDAARRAALEARFSSSTEFLASGTITYIFRMR